MTTSRTARPRTRPVPKLARPRAVAPALTGPLASAAWLAARGIVPANERWSVEIELHARGATFRIEIYREEWGFQLATLRRASWIRVTDLPFVHGRDEFDLLRVTPRLERVGELVRALEARLELAFDRQHAAIRTDLPHAARAITAWVRAL